MIKKLCPVGCKPTAYVLVCREFHYSGLNRRVFKQDYFTSMVKSICVRVSPGSLRQSVMGRVGPGTCRRGGWEERRRRIDAGWCGEGNGRVWESDKNAPETCCRPSSNLPLSGSKLI